MSDKISHIKMQCRFASHSRSKKPLVCPSQYSDVGVCFIHDDAAAMAMNSTVTRRTLHDELLPLLRDMILDGELGPGSRIPEQALCARFGVSRTPLREALKMLSVNGLVHLLPHKGARVVHITQKEAEELIPLLGILEAHASELACAKIDEAV